MRNFDDQRGSNVMQLRAGRLESPKMAGYRVGMSSSTVIGRKLGAVYDVPADRKTEIESALQTLDRRMTTAG